MTLFVKYPLTAKIFPIKLRLQMQALVTDKLDIHAFTIDTFVIHAFVIDAFVIDTML